MAEHGELSDSEITPIRMATDTLEKAEIIYHSVMSCCAAHLFLRELALVKLPGRESMYTYRQNSSDSQMLLSRWEPSTCWISQAKSHTS
jgi:hypothetical protein